MASTKRKEKMPIGIYTRIPEKHFKGLWWMVGDRPPMKGKSQSKKARKKISQARKGWQFSEETRAKMSKARQGKPIPEATRRKMSEAQSGEECYLWQGGISTYERKLFLNARRRAKKKKANGSHTQAEWDLLKEQYKNSCPACGKNESEIRLTEDHIRSLNNGGSDNIENIQPLCRSCNCKKHTKEIFYAIPT